MFEYGLFGVLPGLYAFNNYGNDEFFSLPEEVRTEIENRRDEIHSAEDLHRIAHECMIKR